jgi:desulfoferrodoxin-like iron-binding protein
MKGSTYRCRECGKEARVTKKGLVHIDCCGTKMIRKSGGNPQPKRYACRECGMVADVTHEGRGDLVCCDHKMIRKSGGRPIPVPSPRKRIRKTGG